MKKNNSIFKKIAFWIIIILFFEISFSLLISHNTSLQWITNILLTTTILSLTCTLLTSLANETINKILSGIIIFSMGILFATQAVFFKIFKVYFSLYNLALQDQLSSFVDETIMFIIRYFFYIIWFMIPFIIFLIIKKKLPNNNLSIKTLSILIICIIGSIITNKIIIDNGKAETYSTYDLINNVSNTSLSIQKLGVLNTYYIEGKRMLFGFTPKQIKVVKIPKKETIEKEEVEVEEIKEYEDNILNLNLENTGNKNIDTIHSYIKEEEPTKKNEYTGIFKDYNLIYITAESFSEIGVREDLTPTLYKMINSGFVFKNFYTPNNLSTIGGEFQSLTGLYPDYPILSTWRGGKNTFPYAIANVFKNKGYDTYAYHNNSYIFQDRNLYIASQGFTNFQACYNGLEKRIDCEIWPQSDEEMMNVTKEDYIHNEKPFLAYYMTVSGHFAYTFTGNSMALKNKEKVDNLDLKEGAAAYLATQIELDKALEVLIKTLEEENKLDKTVFVLMADHYPYELDIDSINQLSKYERNNIEINHNALIIWNNKLETKEIEKPCMSSDVLPTVYNLFGIDYDSRLFIGKDILSTSFGIAILSDRSWITEKGVYDINQNKFTPKEDNTITNEYITNVNQLVNNRLTLSKLIIENNYYKYLN